MQALLQNQVFVYCVMAILIFGITQGLKWVLVKPWTNKIKNERVRKIVNTTIYLIPYGLGFLFEFVYTVCYLHGQFSAFMGILHGTSGIALYGLIERFFKIKIPNPYEETEEGKTVKSLMDEITEDGKVDEKDKSALQAFWDKMKE